MKNSTAIVCTGWIVFCFGESFGQLHLTASGFALWVVAVIMSYKGN